MTKIFGGRPAAVLFALSLLLLSLPALAQAQDAAPVEAAQDAGSQNSQGDLMRQLKLTDEQVVKIRAIREQNKDERQSINQRVRMAQRALDRAIYFENADEAVIEQRARELAEAQAAQVRMRALTELNIRRVLSPEQLQTLRELRIQAAENRRRQRFDNNQQRQLDQRPENSNNQPPLRDRLERRQDGTTQRTDRPTLAPRTRPVLPRRMQRP